MIPILYESDEINFISNGIGRLRDCIRCEVTEERNGIYECEFEYPVTGQHFNDITCGRIIAVEHDETGDVQPFDIISYTRPLNGVVTFHAQHISYRQKGITVIASSGSGGRSLPGIFATLKSGWPSNPFSYYSDISGQRRVAAFDLTPRTARQLLGGVEGSILDAFGGEYEWDKFQVNLWKARGTPKDYTIRYGVNLLEFQEELDSSEVFDACIPYWKGEDDLVLADPAMITSGDTPLGGRTVCVPLDVTDQFEEKPTQQQVTAAGTTYMNGSRPYLPSQNISVNFVRLQDSDEYDEYAVLQKCSLCDSVKVVFPIYGVTGSFKIVKVVWDVLLERYVEMELGNLYTTLSQALGISGIQASADQANRNVAGVWGTAADAQATATAASQAAAAAQASATSASEAATTAWNHADEAHQAAYYAQESANQARESAISANTSANNALIQLSVVEDVAGTLRWISEHGDYVLTNDDHVYSDTVYFIKQGGDYIPIASPDPSKNPSAEGWYILDVTQSTTDYIMSHLAVTSYGLWVLPVNNLAEHYLKDSDDNLIIDSNGDEIVDFSDDPQNANGYKVLLSGGTDNPDFPVGLSIYNDEGAVVARYGLEIILGNKDGGEGYALYDYHSMQLYPPGGTTPYFHVSDLRNRDGIATLTEPFQVVKNTSFTYTTISLRAYPVEILKVEVDGVDVTGDSSVYTQHTATLQAHMLDFYFAALPNDVNDVSVTFTTEEAIIAYTFGRRRDTGEWPTGIGNFSLAEGKNTIAAGDYAHAEGLQAEAVGYASHSEGQNTRAVGSYSHAQNYQTIAGYSEQTVIGKYNDNKPNNAFEIGNGSYSDRSNAFEVDWDGTVDASTGYTIKGRTPIVIETVYDDDIDVGINAVYTWNKTGLSKSGYTLAGIVGFYISNATNNGGYSSYCYPYYYRVSAADTITAQIRNIGTNTSATANDVKAARIKVSANILWVADGLI